MEFLAYAKSLVLAIRQTGRARFCFRHTDSSVPKYVLGPLGKLTGSKLLMNVNSNVLKRTPFSSQVTLYGLLICLCLCCCHCLVMLDLRQIPVLNNNPLGVRGRYWPCSLAALIPEPTLAVTGVLKQSPILAKCHLMSLHRILSNLKPYNYIMTRTLMQWPKLIHF